MRVRFSTVALALANAGLVAVLGWGMYTNSQPEWQPMGDMEPATTHAPPVESRSDLAQARRAAIWTRPVFSPDRQPDPAPEAVTANPLSNVTLVGTFQNGDAQWVYLDEPGQPVARLARGETLDNGWTLEQLTPRNATFIRQGQTQTLSLPMLRLPPPSEAPTLTLPRTTTP